MCSSGEEKRVARAPSHALPGALAGQIHGSQVDSPFRVNVWNEMFPARAPKTAGEGARATLFQLHRSG